MEVSSNRRSWRLKSYSRLKAKVQGLPEEEDSIEKSDAEWSTIEDKDDNPLYLHLDLTARFWIMSGTTILENFFLVDSSKWLKGFWKRSELLVSYKCGDQVRIFKQEFDDEQGGREGCAECAKLLGSFFPIDAAEQGEAHSQESSLLPIDPYVSQICSSILTGQTLPELYRKCNYEITNSTEDMESFVVTCLTDPNFPAFVAEVEKAMDRIIGD